VNDVVPGAVLGELPLGRGPCRERLALPQLVDDPVDAGEELFRGPATRRGTAGELGGGDRAAARRVTGVEFVEGRIDRCKR